jgi:hypothetical protein
VDLLADREDAKWKAFRKAIVAALAQANVDAGEAIRFGKWRETQKALRRAWRCRIVLDTFR